MKKISFAVAMVILLSMLLTSCEFIDRFAEPENVDELWERIDEKMDSLKSFRADVDSTISTEYLGVEIEGEIKMVIVSIGNENDEDCYFYSRSKTYTQVGSVTEAYESIMAYDEGMMYICDGNNDQYSRICSETSAKVFLDFYYDTQDADFEISPEDAKLKTFEKIEDEGWKLSYSEFSEKAIKKMRDEFDLDDLGDENGLKITDMIIEITSDEKYRANKMTMKLVAKDEEDPVISTTIRISEYNSAQKVDIDKSEYKKVTDARVAVWTNDFLEKSVDVEYAKFILDIHHMVMNAAGTGIISEYSESDNIICSNEYGVFTYDIEGLIGEDKYDIGYSLGKQIIYKNEKYISTVSESEAQAKSYISELINPLGYRVCDVEDITEYGENGYKITLYPVNASQYRQIMYELDDTYRESKVYLVVEMIDDEIKTIEVHIDIYGYRYSYIVENVLYIKSIIDR